MTRPYRTPYAVSEWTDEQYLAHWKSRCVIDPVTGCWEWQGFCYDFRNIKPGQRGYPSGSYRGKGVRVHKKTLELKLGRPLVKGEVTCHSCDNPPCINPDHLSAGTQEQNKLDEVARGRSFYANKTECKRGHLFTEENTAVFAGTKGRPTRHCRACALGRARVKAGWPEHLAYSLPPGQFGYTPPEARQSLPTTRQQDKP